MATDPATAAAKWAQNLGAATQRIQAGVQGVTVAPGQAAARQKGVYVANVTASADKWATKTAAVSLSDWQQATINKGIPRIATGAQAAEPKFQAFLTKLLPYINSGKASLPARGNLQANTQRAVAWIQYMANFKNS